MTHRIVSTCIVCAGLALSTAAAAQVTEAGAEALRAEVEASMDRLIARVPGLLAAAGPVGVAVSADHYAVTLPPIALIGRNTTLTGLGATVTPTEEGWFTVAPGLAPSLLEPAGAGPSMTLTLEHQSGTMTYAPVYQTDMATDLRFEGLALTTPAPASATLDSLGMDTVSTPLAPDHYDQTTVFAADGLAIEAPDGDWAIDHLGVTIDGRNFDFPAYAAASTATNALIAEHRTATGELPPELLPRLWTISLDYPSMFDAVGVSLSIEGVKVAGPAAMLGAARASMGMTLDGVTSGASTLGLSFGWQDLSVDPLPPQGEFLPTDLSIDLSLAGIPNADVAAALRRLGDASTSMDVASAFQVAARELAPVLLLSPGLVLEVGIAGASETWTLDLAASFHAEPGSPRLVAGSGDLTIGGLDAVIAGLGGTPDAQSALQGLTMLKMIGQEGTDASGHAVRLYKFTMGPQGEVTLNGMDLAPLLKTF
jgi:hypothetical protein